MAKPKNDGAAVEQAEVEQAEVEQAEVEQAEVEQAEVEQAEVEQAEVEQAEVEQAEVEQAEVEQAEVEQADGEQGETIALVKARVLTDCVYGRCDEVVELSPADARDGAELGVIDAHPDAVAYAESLAATADD